MGTVERERSTDPDIGLVCHLCGRPLVEEVTRYKTMGIVVPVWKPGPCRNPDCRESEPVEEGHGKDAMSPDPLGCLHQLRSDHRPERPPTHVNDPAGQHT